MIEATTLNPKTRNSRVSNLVEEVDRFRPGVLGNNLLGFVKSVRSGKEDLDVEWRRRWWRNFGVGRGFCDAEGGSLRSIVRAVEMVPNVHRNWRFVVYTWHIVTRASGIFFSEI